MHADFLHFRGGGHRLRSSRNGRSLVSSGRSVGPSCLLILLRVAPASDCYRPGEATLQVSNDDLAEIVETSDKWISQRTGIRIARRRWHMTSKCCDNAEGLPTPRCSCPFHARSRADNDARRRHVMAPDESLASLSLVGEARSVLTKSHESWILNPDAGELV